ncbi:MAG: cyclic pyranopterin monophosphate synthase MoaC [Armatimonadetes bacterium]|nr:cyclic pyranopterin monophosphate synthase MoaC [Armatimonadota bacterium]
MSNLTHTDAAGRARMVDVSEKPDTRREAEAHACVRVRPETAALIRANALKKGDVLGTARIAGILAAKRTAELIPLCHPIPLTDVDVELEVRDDRVEIRATAATVGKTGVEMEALTAASVAALTVYDMAKAVDREMEIGEIHLVRKVGGRSGKWSKLAS